MEEEVKGDKLKFHPETEELFVKDGMDLRKYVLHSSLLLEHIAMKALRALEGDKAKRYRLEERLERLIEIGVMDKQRKRAFTWFLQIRNQCIHNYEARTMKKCLSFTKSVNAQQMLKAFPPQLKTDEETALVNSFIHLMAYLRDTAQEIHTNALNRIQGR